MIAGLTVSRFLAHHIKARDSGTGLILARTIVLRNEFPEENITGSSWMTSLSGCQTRSLLIAGAILIGRTPISLPDEVENAMTFKERVIHCLKHHHKAVIFVTRDLITGCRIVMRNGAVMNVLEPKDAEKEMIAHITGIDGILCSLREKIRAGDLISDKLKITRPGISA